MTGQRESQVTATVTPSPFGDGAGSSTAVLEASGDGVTFKANGAAVTVHPRRAVLGRFEHVVLHTDDGRYRVRFTDAREIGQWSPEQRDLAKAIRASGTPVALAGSVRAAVGGNRAAAWVGTFGFVCVEFAAIGVPLQFISALVRGIYTTPSGVATAVLTAAFAVFVVLWVAVTPLPALAREAFDKASRLRADAVLGLSDPHPFDWAPNTAFVPFTPRLRNAVLLAYPVVVGVAIAVAGPLTWNRERASESSALEDFGSPDWLTVDVVRTAGFVAAAALLAVFVTSVVLHQRDRDRYTVRWLPLVGAFVTFAFGMAEDAHRNSPLVSALTIVIITAVTVGRLVVAVGIFAVTPFVILMLLAPDPASRVSLAAVMAFIALIAIRYLPGWQPRTAMSVERAQAMRRLVFNLRIVTGVLLVALFFAAWSPLITW